MPYFFLPLIAVNFAGPTMVFAASFLFSSYQSSLALFLDPFIAIVPFLITALYFFALASIGLLDQRLRSLPFLAQGGLAATFFALWSYRVFHPFETGGQIFHLFFFEMILVLLVSCLFAVWLLSIAKALTWGLTLQPYWRSMYLAVNLSLCLALVLHILSRIDFGFYLGLKIPLALSWIFAYFPTLAISIVSVIGWTLSLPSVNWTPRKLSLCTLVFIAPIVLASIAAFVKPLANYVLISAIVWGSSYEFFSPVVLSLSMVLIAIGAFLSFATRLFMDSSLSYSKLVAVSLLGAVLAGISNSPTSVLGVLLCLLFLFRGFLAHSRRCRMVGV